MILLAGKDGLFEIFSVDKIEMLMYNEANCKTGILYGFYKRQNRAYES